MKQITFLILPIVLTISIFLNSCERVVQTRYAIYIDNNSNHEIRFYFDGLIRAHNYPDTILPTSIPPMVPIEAGKRFYQYSSISWEKTFLEFPSDTLSLYVFHPDTLDKYEWSVIREQYKVLKRYDLSIQDLQNSDFIISYP